MDYLDPKKERAQTIRLIIGYILIGLAILIGTLILLYQAYGFGLGRDGQVIQTSLVFVSSQPKGADIYIDGKIYRDDTNTKLKLPTGQYNFELRRSGYGDWKRSITVDGSNVEHFDYPKLFPTTLKTSNLKSYPEAPGLATQSPARRWLVVQQTATPLGFDVFDLADQKNITKNMVSISLPEAVVTSPKEGTHSLKLVEWSSDNRRMLLQHSFNVNNISGSEYILLDRQEPGESVNLTRSLSLTATKELTLLDKKFDQYYVYDTAAKTLGTTNIEAAGVVTPVLEKVIAFKSYGRNIVLYITDSLAPANQVVSMLYDNGVTYKIREHGVNGPFLIDLAEYAGDWYIAAGASGDGKVYVYKNPQQVRKSASTKVLVPVQIMSMNAPNRLQFSANTQYLMIQNGASFVSYDADADKGYRFTSKYPLDSPAPHGSWMDSARLMYVSGGKVAVFDYDNINDRSLVAASPNYLPYFDRDYEVLYTLAPGAGAAMSLTQTSMFTPEDQ